MAEKFFLGVTAAGVVDTVAVASDESLIEAFNSGLVIVPCTVEQARRHWGEKIMEPIQLNGTRGVTASGHQEVAPKDAHARTDD